MNQKTICMFTKIKYLIEFVHPFTFMVILIGKKILITFKFFSSNKERVCHNTSLGFCDQGKGLQGCEPRGRLGSHITCSRECKECEGMNPHTPKRIPMLGVGVPNGLLNFQSTIAEVKTHFLRKFFISLKRY